MIEALSKEAMKERLGAAVVRLREENATRTKADDRRRFEASHLPFVRRQILEGIEAFHITEANAAETTRRVTLKPQTSLSGEHDHEWLSFVVEAVLSEFRELGVPISLAPSSEQGVYQLDVSIFDAIGSMVVAPP